MSKILKITLAIFVLLIAAVVLTAIIAVILFPGEKIKTIVEEKAAEALKMPVSIGSIGLTFAGFPAIKATDINIGESRKGEPVLFYMKSAKVRVNLLRLLKKQVEIVLVELNKPVLTIISHKDGSSNLPLNNASAVEDTEDAAPPAIPFPISLNTLRVRNAGIVLDNSKTTETLITLNKIDILMRFEISGDLKNFTSAGKTIINEITFTSTMDGEPIEDIRAEFDHELNGDLTTGAITLSKGELSVNGLPVNITANIEDWTKISFTAGIEKLGITELLKAIPEGLIPDREKIRSDGNLSLSLDGSIDTVPEEPVIVYNGFLDIDIAALAFEELPGTLDNPVKLSGNIRLTPEAVKIENIRLSSGKSDFGFSGQVTNYTTLAGHGGKPAVFKGTVKSELLDLNDLLVTGEKKEPSEAKSRTLEEILTSLPIPPNLSGDIAISLGPVIFEKLKADSVRGNFTLKDGVFALNGLNISAYMGTLTGSGSMNFADPRNVIYGGNFNLRALDSAHFLADFPEIGEIFKGKLSGSLQFTGAGLDSVSMLENLKASGDMIFDRGQIVNWDFTRKLGEHLKFLDFETLDFDRVKNSFRVENQKFYTPDLALKTKFGDIRVDGFTGFDKTVNYNITLNLDKKTSENALKNLGSLTKYLNATPERLEFNITAGGTLISPSFKLDTSAAEKQLNESLKDRLIKEADKFLDSQDEEIKEKGKKLLKKLFK
ncbi:hypothetical protein ES707_20582 [subsurface metagenome]